MKWKDLIIVGITAVCCWLVFKNNEANDTINKIEQKNDSLTTLDQRYQAELRVEKIKAGAEKAEFHRLLNQVNKDHANQIRKQSRYVRSMDLRIDNLDSSSTLSALSEWLVRETGESLIESN